MSEFIYHIHYRPGFKIGKPDSVFRHSGEDKSAMESYVFDEGQLLDLENDDVGEKENVEDIELQEIDVGTWETKNGL